MDVTRSEETSGKSRRVRVAVWLVSLVLVITGIVLIIVGLHGPRVGPSLPSPVGKTTAPKFGQTTGDVVGQYNVLPSKSPGVVVSTTAFRVGPSENGDAAQTRPFVKGATTTFSVRPGGLSGPLSRSSRLSTTTTIARSVPTHLSVPSLGISVRLTELGLTNSGAVQVPSSFSTPGWYDEGYAPGQIGSAVILGHVDSTSGPGVFYRLVDMKVGQRVQVTLADQETLTFKVIGLRQYPKNLFPLTLIYGPKSYSALNLVTCGGVFDPTTHHYLSNIVVFTTLVSSH